MMDERDPADNCTDQPMGAVGRYHVFVLGPYPQSTSGKKL